jgi:hypothetical protein
MPHKGELKHGPQRPSGTWRAIALAAHLSRRNKEAPNPQREILRLLAEGKSNKDIAGGERECCAALPISRLATIRSECEGRLNWLTSVRL